MTLLFSDRKGKLRIIAKVQTEEEAWDKIVEFCKSHNYTIPYVRMWEVDGFKYYDVGSHTEKFVLRKANENEKNE